MSIQRYNDSHLAKFATDAIVIILFFVLLNTILAFGVMLWFLCWLLGLT